MIKRAEINPINEKHNESSQYAVTVMLNLEEIKNDSQRIEKIKYFIDKYNWEGINYPSGKGDWKKFEKIIQQIPLKFYVQKGENISCICFKA